MRTTLAASSSSSMPPTTARLPSPPPPPPLYLAEGLLAVIKPLTWTSNDVVSYIRGILIQDAKGRGVTDEDEDRTKKKKKWTGRRKNQRMKVGHGGTLDPLASGVLVLGVGKGTTLLQRYLEGDKRYVASVQLGYETDTLDCEGAVVRTAPWEHVAAARDIVASMESKILPKFRGKIQQIPPLYSAIRVGGQRLYDIARKTTTSSSVPTTKAEDVEIPMREVEIYGLHVGRTLEDDVIRAGMVDGPRYREMAKVVEDAAAAAVTAANARHGVDDGGETRTRTDRVDTEDVGNDETDGGGTKEGKKRKRGAGGKKSSKNTTRHDMKKKLFDEVTVPSIQLTDKYGTTTTTSLEMPQFALSVECGGGTYIRSLVRDIGYELNTVATMTGLVRTKQGPFVLRDALTKEHWTADAIYDAIRRTNRERDDTTYGKSGDGMVLDIRGGGGGEELRDDEEPPPPPCRFYPIGTPGTPWTDFERTQWKMGMKVQRSYKKDVLDTFDKLDDDIWEVVKYGELSHDPEHYPLFLIQSKNWDKDKPCMLITGGVHGYETSGVHGALLFLQSAANGYIQDCNIIVVPCVSPWAYEHIQRWNANCKDVNRSFKEGSETEESRSLMSYLRSLSVEQWTCHVDLHETTDTDATEFMPAKAAEAGLMYEAEAIPDGFYLAGESENGQLDFQEAVIASVRGVTHIALPDNEGNIIGVPVVKDGVILIPAKTLGLCCSAMGARYMTTTEVYPDSPRATDEICNQAQVAAIVGALDYVLSSSS